MVNPDAILAKPDFRLKMLALLVHTDWLHRYGTIMLPEHFPTDAEREIVAFINTYFDTYHESPDFVDLLDGVADDNELLPKLENFKGALQYACDTAMDFIKVEAMRVAILESVEHINAGNMAAIRSVVEAALSVGVDRLNLGMDLIDDMEDWIYDEVQGRRYPTGWLPIDTRLGGGLVGGEFGLIMAPTGKGKSTALINIGCACAGLISRANVLHITCEMRPQKVLKRYALRISGIGLDRSTRYVDSTYLERFKARAAKMLRARIRVAYGQNHTVSDLRVIIDNLRMHEDFDTRVLIVDYPDLLIPSRYRKERRFELRDIVQDLRDLAGEYDIPVWGATQAGRQALGKEVITLADIAEAMEKANIADIVIALCQTADEESMGIGRLFGAKVRDAESGWFEDVKVNHKKQAITVRRMG